MREIELIGISIDIVCSGDGEGIVPLMWLLMWLEVTEEMKAVGEIVEMLPLGAVASSGWGF